MNTTLRFGIAALVCAIAIPVGGCDKNAVQDITGPIASSRVKFFNFGVGAPAVNFYANETKMTAVVSTTGNESTSGVGYGGVGAGGFYTAIAPGPYILTGRISGTVDKNLPIATLTAAIEDGKHYSFYMSGLYNTTTKTVDAFVVDDPVVPPTDFTVAQVRFVHAISNANALTLYAKSTTGDTATRTLSPAVAYKAAGGFTALPAGVYNIFVRYTDSTTNKISRTNVSFSGGRLYTIGARGDITVTTGAALPALDNTTNR